jgi:hypothetical protein
MGFGFFTDRDLGRQFPADLRAAAGRLTKLVKERMLEACRSP